MAEAGEDKRYTPGEEVANSLTHGLGAGLAVAGLAVLVTFAGLQGDPWRVVSFAVYGASLTVLFLASTFYHAFRKPSLKRVFRRLDHTAIFLLIAGTYTPINLVTLGGGWGWTLFGITWGLAAAGIAFEMVFFDRLRWLTIATYVGMGWLAVIATEPLVEALPWGGLAWLVAGGLCYTGGVAFYLWRRLPFHHAIWHLFVLGGSVCHFFCFLLYVLPQG